MKRVALLLVVTLAACNSEKLTGPAAREAVATHQSKAAAIGDVVYYLDGKEITAKQVEGLDANSIESIEVIKGSAAQRYLGTSAHGVGVVLITSKPAGE